MIKYLTTLLDNFKFPLTKNNYAILNQMTLIKLKYSWYS